MDVRSLIRGYVTSRVASPLEDGDDLFELGLVDSLFGLQLVSFVEQEFGVLVEGDDLDISNFCSIDALSGFVTARLAADYDASQTG